MLGTLSEEDERQLQEELAGAPPTMAVALKPAVLYKSPRILVSVPTGLRKSQASAAPAVLNLEEWISQVIPLNSHESDQGIFAQMRALHKRYAELWRLYIFAHPALFETDLGQAVLWRLKARWEGEMKRTADLRELPATVATSDLRTQDVVESLSEQGIVDLLMAAWDGFPGISLARAAKLIRAADVSKEVIGERIRNHAEARQMAAKRGARVLEAGDSWQVFERCIRGEPPDVPGPGPTDAGGMEDNETDLGSRLF